MSTEEILETFHFHVLKRFLSVSVKLSAMFLRRLKHVSGLLGGTLRAYPLFGPEAGGTVIAVTYDLGALGVMTSEGIQLVTFTLAEAILPFSIM